MDRIDYRPITDFDKQFLGKDRKWSQRIEFDPEGFTRDSEGGVHFCDGTEQQMHELEQSRSVSIIVNIRSFGVQWNNQDLEKVKCADRV